MISNTINNSIPWVEKYRPSTLENIVLDDWNKKILNSILSSNYFPNTLFFGPPGTGKTTTIINLIKKYQHKYYGKSCNELIIHLNASDERGIDTIRSQIQDFIKSKNLFTKGNKFVILDEVDYMTKNGQLALKTLVEKYKHNVSFCLICNYISKIDKPLQDLCIHFRFTQLPKQYIKKYLTHIVDEENIEITNDVLDYIITYYKSDIRSMINYIQINQYNLLNMELLNEEKFAHLYNLFINNHTEYQTETQEIIYQQTQQEYKKYINLLKKKCNIHERNLLKQFCYYLFFNNLKCGKGQKLIDIIHFILHNNEIPSEHLFDYLWSNLNGSDNNSISKL